MSQKRATQQDIANALGLSKTTVSLAMRNHPRITEAVRKKVKEKAIELGYSPDPMLSALAKYSQVIQKRHEALPLAFLNLQPDPKIIHQSQGFVHYLNGAKEAASQLGFKIAEFALADIHADRLNTILKTRGIRGLLLSPPDFSNPIDWEHFPWQDYAAIRFGRSETFPLTHFVTSAQSTNAIIAFDKMRERGYERIGLVTGYRRRRVFGAGYYWAQFELPIAEQLPILNLPWEMPETEKKACFKHWLSENQPDAILSDTVLSLSSLLPELGHNVPNDIALATTSIHDNPIDAGIDQKPDEIGRAAVRSLVAQLSQNAFGLPEIRNEILIEGQWIDGSMLPKRTS